MAQSGQGCRIEAVEHVAMGFNPQPYTISLAILSVSPVLGC